MTFWHKFAVVLIAISYSVVAGVQAECPLDHYFFGQEDEQLFVEKSRIYANGVSAQGYYGLSWSPIYQRWTVGQPGFSDTTDAAYGFPTEIQLQGTPNADYQIWFEILDLSPDFRIQMNDGTWLDTIGDRYNLSNWGEHHVHMKYCAYVAGSPAPDYPFYVTYRLVDDLGPYQPTAPFSLVFNTPTPTVEATTPDYEGILPSITAAEIVFQFHRPIAVVDGPPVTITDEATHTYDYYTDYFDYEISSNGMALVLTQTSGVLPNETWLEIELTDNTRDAVTDFAVVPFTQFAYTLYLPGNCDGDDDVDLDDFASFAACIQGPSISVDEECECADVDQDDDVDLVDFAIFQESLGRFSQ